LLPEHDQIGGAAPLERRKPSAERIRTSETPTAESVAWTTQPAAMPGGREAGPATPGQHVSDDQQGIGARRDGQEGGDQHEGPKLGTHGPDRVDA
jgi:hypothetical protein